MRTCPSCARRYTDDVAVCPEDHEPLGAVTVTGPKSGVQIDEETVVRPKQARPLERPRFTEVRIGPAGSAPMHAVVSPDGPTRVYRERPAWPLVAAVAGVAIVVVLAAVYYITAGQSDLAKEVSAQITDARIAVADARARLESLPTDSPLRNKVLTLQQWDRELQNLELGQDRTREVAARAREIAGQARAVGEEARVAGATVPQSPPVVQPATEQPAAPPDAPPVDPMATSPAETPTTAPATNTSPQPPKVTPGTGQPPVDGKTTPESTHEPATAKEPDGKGAPSKTAPPPPPPSPEEKKPG